MLTIFFKPAKTGTSGIREHICNLNCWEIQNIYFSTSRCSHTKFYLLKRHEPLAAENISTKFVIFVTFYCTLENTSRPGGLDNTKLDFPTSVPGHLKQNCGLQFNQQISQCLQIFVHKSKGFFNARQV